MARQPQRGSARHRAVRAIALVLVLTALAACSDGTVAGGPAPETTGPPTAGSGHPGREERVTAADRDRRLAARVYAFSRRPQATTAPWAPRVTLTGLTGGRGRC